MLGLLAAGALDLQRPVAGSALRVHVIDASGSVAVRGRQDSFDAADAARLVESAIARGGRSAVIAAGARPVLTLPPGAAPGPRDLLAGADPSGSDLAAALDLAGPLAEGGDVVLYSDGRSWGGDLETALVRLRAPVHVFPLGPYEPVEARLAAVEAPATVPPGARWSIRVTVRATAPWNGALECGALPPVPLAFERAGDRDVVLDGPALGAAPLLLEIRLRPTTPDACPRNDSVKLVVRPEDRRPVIHVAGPPGAAARLFPAERYVVRGSPGLDYAPDVDVVVIEGLAARSAGPEALERLARDVKDGGLRLLILGGSSGFALGGWAGGPLESVSPFWAFPDERSAVCFLLDRSGSMEAPPPGLEARKLDLAASALLRAASLSHPDDDNALVAFASRDQVLAPLQRGTAHLAAALKGLRPEGSTVLAEALRAGLAQVRASTAGRRRLVLVTDGESVEEPDVLRQAASALKAERVGLVIVRLGAATTPALKALLETADGVEVPATDYAQLDRALAEALARSRDLARVPAADPTSSGPLLEGLALAPGPARMNRVSLRPAAAACAWADGMPLAATLEAGRGRSAAIATSFEEGWAWPAAADVARRLVDRLLEGPGRDGARAALSFEGLEVVARVSLAAGARPDSIEAVLQAGDDPPRAITLVRRGADLYEGRAPAPEGSVVLRLGGRTAAVAVRPHSPEWEQFGPDLEALRRIAERTGGRIATSPAELAAIPTRGPEGRRSLRPWCFGLALLFFLAEIAAATFLKR